MVSYIVQTFCQITRISVIELLEKYKTDEKFEIKDLLNALRSTIQFESKMSEDLKEEYSKYIEPQEEGIPGASPKVKTAITELHKETKRRGTFTIQSLYKVKTSISGCFEPYLQPYVDKERESLLESVLKSLNEDLNDPQENSTTTEEVKILNSSLHFINKVKFLMRRASSISSGETLFKIF
jgi:DNA-binding transcriptional regulator GbsR (MarR family)